MEGNVSFNSPPSSHYSMWLRMGGRTYNSKNNSRASSLREQYAMGGIFAS